MPARIISCQRISASFDGRALSTPLAAENLAASSGFVVLFVVAIAPHLHNPLLLSKDEAASVRGHAFRPAGARRLNVSIRRTRSTSRPLWHAFDMEVQKLGEIEGNQEYVEMWVTPLVSSINASNLQIPGSGFL